MPSDLPGGQRPEPVHLAHGRRKVLQAIAGTALALLAPLPGAAQTQEPNMQVLDAFLDTLLPQDAFSPAASSLGIGQDLVALGPAGSDWHRFLGLGTAWLDGLNAAGFAQLPPDARVRILEWMQQADTREIPGRFFQIIRRLAIELYFTHPASLAGLNLNTAPQPEGYPPPWT